MKYGTSFVKPSIRSGMRGHAPAAPIARARRLVFTTKQDQLRLQIGLVQRLGDFDHLHRALAAEHHDAGGPAGVEAEAGQFARAIHGQRLVEARIEDHARDLENVGRRKPQRARLVHRAPRSADHVLFLPLDPEVRRVVGDVGQDGHQRRSRPRPSSACLNARL